VKKFFIKNKEY